MPFRLFFCLLISPFFIFAEEKVSDHSSYTAAVGSSGEIGYIAYTKAGEGRPITFAFNGGPGSSSVWLHMGCLGPRRVLTPEEGQQTLPPYKIVDNEETLLDLTDLVFIDPSGTGLSQPQKEGEEKKNAYSIQGDIQTVGDFIRDYLTSHGRWNSPKYLAGESYGALRAAGLSDYLQNEYDIFLNGVIFISAALDYQTLIFHPDNPLPYFLFLPTYATTAWYHGLFRPEATVEEVAQSARDFALKTYGPALLCPKCYNGAELDLKLSEMTGLPLYAIQREAGRISASFFFSELLAQERKVIGRFDSRILGETRCLCQDPSASLISGIFAGAFHDYLNTELGCAQPYRLLSQEVHEKWDYWDYNFFGYPSAMQALRNALIANPKMKLFVSCGYFDLATPFATVEYCFDHLEIPNPSLQIEYYEGGHMFYLNPSARIKFKRDLSRFYERAP